VETKRFFGSFVHVILTRQTCGQRSSRAVESKPRALGNCFSERICYMLPMSTCRGDRDLGLCTTSVLASEKKRVSTQEKSDFAAIALRFSKRKYRISILPNFIVLGVCSPQPCSSAGRRFTASRSRVQNYRRIISFLPQKIRWNTL